MTPRAVLVERIESAEAIQRDLAALRSSFPTHEYHTVYEDDDRACIPHQIHTQGCRRCSLDAALDRIENAVSRMQGSLPPESTEKEV
jgi:hypothetical protein